MTEPLRIAVADDEPRMREFFEVALPELGHQVVVLAGSGQELVDGCRAAQPDLVITDIRMPDMDGLEAARLLRSDQPLPIILVSAFHDPELIERAAQSHVLAYLVKPIKTADLQPAIALAMLRFREFQALFRETDSLRQALEDRKLIERAKGILMKRSGLGEEHAFRRLQQLASERKQKLAEIASQLILADKAFEPDFESRSRTD